MSKSGAVLSFRQIAILTAISVAIGVVIAVGTNLPLSSDKWQSAIRDGISLVLLSELLLLAIGLLYEISKTDLFATIRFLHSSDERRRVFESIKETDASCLGYPFFRRRIDVLLREFANKQLNTLQQGDYHCSKGEILDRTSELYADTQAHSTILAVSFVDITKYWGSKQFGPPSIEMNRQAALRGVKIERIFIFVHPREIIDNAKLLEAFPAEINLYYVLTGDVVSDLHVDFSLYGNEYVQYFEFDPATYNKEYAKCTISRRPAAVNRFREIYGQLRQCARPLKAVSARSSLWGWEEIRSYYMGTPPDLHLDKLKVTPKTVLDIGCGAGRCFQHFLLLGCEITGVEEDPVAFDLCRAKSPNARIINGHYPNVPLDDSRFDVVVAYNSIYHCKKDDMFFALDHITKSIKPGGFLLLTLKTVTGNEAVVERATMIEDNTWINCNFPDYDRLHHFCTDQEIRQIKDRFFETVYEEEIPLLRRDGMIIQGRGYYMILRTKPPA